MKRFFILLLAAFGLVTAGLTEAQQSEYASLVARIKSGDVYVNFKRLRLAYAASPERQKAKDTQNEKGLAGAALLNNQFARVIEYTDVVLDNDYTNLAAHIIQAKAYLKLKDEQKADFHKAIASGLLGSILEDKSGASKKDAWIVISEEEERTMLATLEWHEISHTPVQDGRHSYDLVEVIDPETKKTVKRYFNLDLLPKS